VAPDRPVAVREWGAAEGRPLLYWHGLNPFAALALNEAGPVWAARGFHVLAPDFPELADSDAYRPSRLADLAVELAGSFGAERFAYVGWSWGGSIGVHLATRHPDRLTALVLLDAGHNDVQLDASLEEVERHFLESDVSFADRAEFLAAAREGARAWRPALEERLLAGMTERDGRIVSRFDPRLAAWAIWGVAAEPPSGTHARLGELDVPILLVLAEENETREAADAFRTAVPRAEVVSIRSRHDLLADAPEETAAVVAGWLESALAGRE
jgi:lipase